MARLRSLRGNAESWWSRLATGVRSATGPGAGAPLAAAGFAVRGPAAQGFALAGLLTLPLVGAAIAGEPVGRYLHFPPTTVYVEQPGFSWWLTGPLIAAALGVVLFLALRLIAAGKVAAPAARGAWPLRLPWWGWAAIGFTALAWLAAWTRWDLLEPVQRHTFTPLWLGYIVTVNALSVARTGHSLMTRRPLLFLALFPLSALFWWFFEYLNRFVQNWAYFGLGDISAAGYVLMATPAFATVIPAVLSTTELISSFPRLREALSWPSLPRLAHPRPAGWALLLAASGGLLFIGVWPAYFFPLVWVAPLLLLTAVALIRERNTVLEPVRAEGWPLWAPSLAALICGFFWEMWNAGSLAHWEYSVPFVQRWLLFEMPAVGYLGYLPFGFECVAAASLLPGWLRQRSGVGPSTAGP